MTTFSMLFGIIAFVVLGPVIGCLLAGIDRKVSARMQGRVGPKLLQPYWDVRKLWEKETVSVNGIDHVYILCALVFTMIAGAIFFGGGNFILCIFIITLAELFFCLAAYSTRSPYAEVGAHRETLQIMACEPMELFVAVAFYMATGTFTVAGALQLDHPAVCGAWLCLLGFIFILTVKMRKSPFDLSYSHHAHQDLVKGVSTEMNGRTLALVEITHWCENVLFLGWVALFFLWSSPLSALIALIVVAVIYFLEIWIDNNFARVKWQALLIPAWGVALVCGTINLILLVIL